MQQSYLSARNEIITIIRTHKCANVARVSVKYRDAMNWEDEITVDGETVELIYVKPENALKHPDEE